MDGEDVNERSMIQKPRDPNITKAHVEEASTRISKFLRLFRPKRRTPTHTRTKSPSEERKDFSLADPTLSDTETASYKDGESSGSLKGNDVSVKRNTGNTTHASRISVEEHVGASGSDKGLTLMARSSIRRGSHKLRSKSWAVSTHKPPVDLDSFEDPLADAFWKDVWVASADHNVCIHLSVIHLAT